MFGASPELASIMEFGLNECEQVRPNRHTFPDRSDWMRRNFRSRRERTVREQRRWDGSGL